MRILLAVIVLIVGCSMANNPTSGTYMRNAELAKESEEISTREHRCIRATVARSNEQIARIASTSEPAADAGNRVQMAAKERDRNLAKCKATADYEENELSARQRAEYQRQVKEQREHNALIMILTTSLPR